MTHSGSEMTDSDVGRDGRAVGPGCLSCGRPTPVLTRLSAALRTQGTGVSTQRTVVNNGLQDIRLICVGQLSGVRAHLLRSPNLRGTISTQQKGVGL